MKVLQLGKFYPIRGGVEKVMWDLTLGLGEAGVDCDMLCAARGEDAGKIIELTPHSRVICVRAITKLAATMISPAMVWYLRRHRDYDLVHIHHPDPMAALALFLSGYKGPVVVHWHSDILKQKTILKFYRPLQSWMLRRAALIVGTTPVYVAESPELTDFRDKLSYLPIGVPPVSPDAGKVAGIRALWPGKKIVFSLGRFVEYKGFEYLVRAAKLLPEEYMVVIGGEGPLKPRMEALVEELGLKDKVFMPGRIAEEDVESWFGACNLFVLSSVHKTEAFAIVQIEAMSCGKPVVATRIPASGVSWVNANGVSGLNVEPGNPEELSEAIVALCSDGKAYTEYASRAKSRYGELFTKEKMIAGCKALYDKVLASNE